MTIDLATLRRNTGPKPPTPEPAPFGAVFGAAWQKTTVEQDTFGYEAGLRQELMTGMLDRLSPASRAEVHRQATGRRFADPVRAFTALVLDAASREAATDPLKWADDPLDEMQFQARIDARRQAEIAEAEEVLAMPGGGLAEFLGSTSRMMVDPVNIALAPLGGGGGLVRMMASEALLGAVAEGLAVPRETEVARELGRPEPELVPRLAMGALAGGGLAGILGGAFRYGSHVLAKRQAIRNAAPDGMRPQMAEAEAEAAEARMRGTETAEARMAESARRPTPGQPPAMADFDFSLSGNASPKTNRVGYLFGRLIERGMDPHIAAGFVGNAMAESGVGVNPRAVGDGGAAYGMFQWNGPRNRALQEFARKAGKSPEDIDTQIDFLFHELETSEAAAWAIIRGAKTAEEAAALVSQHFERPGTPHLSRRTGHARDVMGQFEDGAIPKWSGKVPPDTGGPPVYGTSRGYTGEGQVTAGDIRLDVRYEVVDASLLRFASGELQPRDRSRLASDEQIAEIAARLDPARLGPSPEADRGAPIVGPDDVIESGNGRVRAIMRAYERHPDRGDAYRAMIEETTGAPIPAGVAQPVLIARRTTDLDPAQRADMVRAANSSAVARMSATERARSDATILNDTLIRAYSPDEDLAGAGNREFTRGFLARLPQAERGALVDEGGALNSEGIRRIGEALFARGWDAPDIVARFAERQAGELRSLVDGLADAAPAWAALRSDIAAGEVRPEFDIGPFVLDAMRLIALARSNAARDGGGIGAALDLILNQPDLTEGVLSPLTARLVAKFWADGRAASKKSVADFLTRYAAEARKVGGPDGGLLGDAPSPADVLRAIDSRTFAGLPDDFGRPRETATRGEVERLKAADMPAEAFARGADSPEAEAADAAALADLREPAVAQDEAEGELRAALLAARAEFGDVTFRLDAEGTRQSVADLLDDIEAGRELSEVLALCNPGGQA